MTRNKINITKVFLSTNICIFAMLITSKAYAGDGYFPYGQGIKAKGAGGAQTAFADEATAIAINPALTKEIGNRIDIGVEVANLDAKSSRHDSLISSFDGEFDSTNAPLVLPNISAVKDLDDRQAVGISFYSNGGIAAKYNNNPYTPAHSGMASVNMGQYFLSPTYAYKLSDSQTIGFSANVLVQSFAVKGLSVFESKSINPNNVTDNGHDISYGLGASFGYLADISDNLQFGAFYRSKTNSQKLGKYSGLLPEAGDLDVPSSYGIGLHYEPLEVVSLDFDARRINYSDVKAYNNHISQNNPSNDADKLGGDNGAGFGWKDINSYKFGVNFQQSEKLTLRAGYAYVNSPIRPGDTYLGLMVPAIIKDQYSIGATYKNDDKSEISFYAMRAPKEKVYGKNSIPSYLGGGEADISLGETSFGVSYGIKY